MGGMGLRIKDQGRGLRTKLTLQQICFCKCRDYDELIRMKGTQSFLISLEWFLSISSFSHYHDPSKFQTINIYFEYE